MKNRIFILSVLLIMISTSAFAFQGPSPTPPGLPIDGFVSLFLAAGAVVGIKNLNKKK